MAAASQLEWDEVDRVKASLGGTVAIPSPVPATGNVYLVVDPAPEGGDSPPTLFLKSVQSISDHQVVTRYISLDDVRAVTFSKKCEGSNGASAERAAKKDPASQQEQNGTLCQPKLRAEVKKKLNQMAPPLSSNGVQEALLFDGAVLHVPESASVLLKLNYRLGVTAAESIQNLPQLLRDSGCC